jgi:hypothetical protein
MIRRCTLFATIALACVTELSGQTATMQGRVRWQASNNAYHPAGDVLIEVVDDRTRTVLSEPARTNDNGEYRVVVNTGSSTRSVRLRAVCESPVAYVHTYSTTDRWALESPDPIQLAPGTALEVDLDGTQGPDNNSAFSVLAALHAIQPYVVLLRGSRLARIEVVFPTDEGTSQFGGTRMDLLQEDRWDWDVILHEYGHYVSNVAGIARSPGGSHGPRENLARRMSKDSAMRLAWGEGWPTYFSISGQIAAGMDGLGLPNVGDSRYVDSEDSTIDYDVGSQDPFRSPGEDNETSTARVLFDFEDGLQDYDSVALGAKAVYDSLVVESATAFGPGYRRLFSRATWADSLNAGRILAEHGLAAVATAPADNFQVTATRPTFRWNASLTAVSGDRFIVKFFNRDGQLLHESAETTSLQYTPPQAAWDAIRAATRWPVLWVVYMRNSTSPATGPYSGSVRRLQGP